MVLLWILGDSGRLAYYIMRKQPYQFILGGSSAVLVDCIVMFQFFYYRIQDSEDTATIETIEKMGKGDTESVASSIETDA